MIIDCRELVRGLCSVDSTEIRIACTKMQEWEGREEESANKVSRVAQGLCELCAENAGSSFGAEWS